MKKILLTLLVPTLVAVTLFTCAKQEEKNEKQAVPSVDESAVAVNVTTVKEGSYGLPVISTGIISTGTESRLSFKVGGIVSRLLVEEGQSVVRGQLLAALDLTEIDAQVSQAHDALEKSKRDFERIDRLFKDSAATLEQWQNTKTALDVATQGHRVALFNKQYASIHASTSGKVIRKLVNEGELVGPGTPVLMINAAGENDWIVRIGLPDVDWVRIKKGDPAVVKTDAYPGEELAAEVSLINEGTDPMSGLYPVEIKVNPKNRKLASGMIARVEIVPASQQQLKSVPIEAIVEGSGNDAFVFVVADDGRSVRKLPIKIGYLTTTEAMITNGLEGVTEVITGGSAFLTQFSTIKVASN